MRNEYAKPALMGGWVVLIAVVGYVSGATSLVGWTALGILALTAPLVMMRFWNVPAQSMSESIQEALRRPDGGFSRGGPR